MSEQMQSQAMTKYGQETLTARQRLVLERIDRRMPIKVIAQELGVSETRINQHIRALKDIYQVASLNELVELYRLDHPESGDHAQGLNNSAYTKKQMPLEVRLADTPPRVDPGEIVISDILPLKGSMPWEIAVEPRIVPGALDGEHAAFLRLAAIVGIAFGILAAVVLMVTATVTLSEAMNGVAHIPVDQD